MARHYNFTNIDKEAVFQRQSNLCACCGEDLRDTEDRAHHIIADQAGKDRLAFDAFIGTSDNCVYLCLLCHDVVHEGGRFRSGALAPPSYFKYSHGRERTAHDEWVMRLDQFIARKYGK
jgi:hypothetical protein